MEAKTGKLIAIDGPGGVGKSSVARELAARLGYYFFSSGLIYRAMAWKVLENGWDGASEPDYATLAAFDLQIDATGGVLVNGQAVSTDLHAEAISTAASAISTRQAIRDQANQVQKQTVNRIRSGGLFPGVILEGRDIGTVVFPDADHKFFLTADESIRAERRYLEKKDHQQGLTREAVLASLKERDRRDEEREPAPMKPAEDARIIDTSDLTMDQVLEVILDEMEKNR